VLRNEDFKDDRKDAGDIGAGHSVTALYEIVPSANRDVAPDDLKYQASREPTLAARSNEVVTLKLRYKAPDGDVSRELVTTVMDEVHPLQGAVADLKFAVSVAEFGLLLRDSEHQGSATYAMVERLAREGIGLDTGGYRREFVGLVASAARLASPSVAR
jgi:Ca-activated chloride channel family protein